MIAKPWTPELIRDAAYFRRAGWTIDSISLWTGIEPARVRALFPAGSEATKAASP